MPIVSRVVVFKSTHSLYIFVVSPYPLFQALNVIIPRRFPTIQKTRLLKSPKTKVKSSPTFHAQRTRKSPPAQPPLPGESRFSHLLGCITAETSPTCRTVGGQGNILPHRSFVTKREPGENRSWATLENAKLLRPNRPEIVPTGLICSGSRQSLTDSHSRLLEARISGHRGQQTMGQVLSTGWGVTIFPMNRGDARLIVRE